MIPTPTWANHRFIFEKCGLQVQQYRCVMAARGLREGCCSPRTFPTQRRLLCCGWDAAHVSCNAKAADVRDGRTAAMPVPRHPWQPISDHPAYNQRIGHQPYWLFECSEYSPSVPCPPCCRYFKADTRGLDYEVRATCSRRSGVCMACRPGCCMGCCCCMGAACASQGRAAILCYLSYCTHLMVSFQIKPPLRLQGMVADLKTAPEGAIVILHACAHNPTGAYSSSCSCLSGVLVASIFAARAELLLAAVLSGRHASRRTGRQRSKDPTRAAGGSCLAPLHLRQLPGQTGLCRRGPHPRAVAGHPGRRAQPLPAALL